MFAGDTTRRPLDAPHGPYRAYSLLSTTVGTAWQCEKIVTKVNNEVWTLGKASGYAVTYHIECCGIIFDTPGIVTPTRRKEKSYGRFK